MTQYAFKVKISDHIIEDNIGQLICLDVPLARDGSYEYSSDEVFEDGKFNIIELHRDWEEVRKLKHTLEGKPVVYYHPDKKTDITIDNIAEFTVGHAQNIREGQYEGYNVLIGDLFISDPETKEAIKSKKLREISLGYFYDVDDSNKNHLRQVNMIAEHIAIVHNGRAGIAKILDSASDEYILAKIRLDGSVSYLEYADEIDIVANRKWNKLKAYGYFRFNNYLDFDQASRVTLRTIGMVVDEMPTGVFVVLNDNKNIVKCYYFGKVSSTEELIQHDYDLSEFTSIDNALDPYAIPDEINEPEEIKSTWNTNDVIAVGLQLEPLLKDIDKSFGNLSDSARGLHWRKMVNLLQDYREMVETTTGKKLPEDTMDGEYLYIGEMMAFKAKKMTKRAHDEMLTTLIVVAFDKEKSSVELVNNINEAISFFKKNKISVKTADTLEMFISETNEITGAYVFKLQEFESKIIVANATSEEDVSVYVCNDVDELNKAISEYFKSLEDAVMTINNREGKYSTMSALLI